MTNTRTAIVTGASSGIGRAIAVALGGLHWTVAIGARRVDRLEETAKLLSEAGGAPVVQALDVADSESIDAFVGAVRADVLINNAGTAELGAVHDMSDDDSRRIVETNLLGPMMLTRRIVAQLREDHRPGDVVFISSDTTVHPRPHMATYLASKAGLEAYAATLALEGEGAGIRASVIRCGPTATSFGDDWDLAQFETLLPYWQRFGIQRHFLTMEPEDVARAVVGVVTAPAHMWMPIVEVQPNPPVT